MSEKFAKSYVIDVRFNEDPTVWLDGARPANTSIPPSILWNTHTQLHDIPTPKNTFANIKKLAEENAKLYDIDIQFNEDPNVWLDGARHANTCISPSISGNTPVQPHDIHPPKIHLQALNNWLNFFSKLYVIYIQFNEDPTVWLDANNCIPPSIPGNAPVQLHDTPTPKNILPNIKKLAENNCKIINI